MAKRTKRVTAEKRGGDDGDGGDKELTGKEVEHRARSASPPPRPGPVVNSETETETSLPVYDSANHDHDHDPDHAFPEPLVYELEPLDFDQDGQTRLAPTDHAEMDQNWPSNYYGYFGNDSATRATDRGGSSTSPNEDESQQRRSNQYLPPHPHSTSPHTMNLPPFQQTFYPSSYHSPTGPSHPSAGPPVNQASGGGVQHQHQQQQQQHHMGGGAHHGGPIGYGNQHMMPPPGANPYPYPVASPAMSAPPLPGSGGPRQPPPHSYTESPRLASGGGGGGGYSSSPGFHHLSPTSPTNHLIPPGIQASSASTSSSSYQSARAGMQALMRDNKRRSGSEEGHSGESWDEGDMKDGKGLGGEQPWGMPQEEYKALNPRDKKQVRNRIGARRFRAKRKDYVSNLEHTLKQRDDECGSLRTQLESQRNEINDLRHRLGMPLLPPPPPAPAATQETGGLGLVVPGAEWDVKDNRKEV